jgi:hypothetical protein
MKKKKNKIGICSICGEEEELTREHIPPKGIFLNRGQKTQSQSFPAKSVTIIPNLMMNTSGFGLQREPIQIQNWQLYGRIRLLDRVLREVRHFLKRIQDDHKSLLEHHARIPLKTYENEIVPDELLSRCYKVDAERIKRVACKIVKGLYFHHFSEPLPYNVELTVLNEPIHLDIRVNIIKARKGMVGGEEGEFIYWFKFDDIEPYFSRWVLFFYLQNYLKVETKLKSA